MKVFSHGQTDASRQSVMTAGRPDQPLLLDLTTEGFRFFVRLYRSRLVILQQGAIVRQLLARPNAESGLTLLRIVRYRQSVLQPTNDGGGNHRVSRYCGSSGPDDRIPSGSSDQNAAEAWSVKHQHLEELASPLGSTTPARTRVSAIPTSVVRYAGRCRDVVSRPLCVTGSSHINDARRRTPDTTGAAPIPTPSRIIANIFVSTRCSLHQVCCQRITGFTRAISGSLSALLRFTARLLTSSFDLSAGGFGTSSKVSARGFQFSAQMFRRRIF